MAKTTKLSAAQTKKLCNAYLKKRLKIKNDILKHHFDFIGNGV